MLYRVLYRLWAQHDEDYEVLVSIDDDSDFYPKSLKVCKDFENKMVLRYFNTAQYKRGVNWDKTAGWSSGEGWSVESYPYNVGIRHAEGDIILLNSGDVMSITNTIAQHRKEQETNSNIVLVSTVHALTASTQNRIDSFDWEQHPEALLFWGSCMTMYSGMGLSYTENNEVEEAHNPYHFLMSVPRKALFDIRGFDEDYFGQMDCGDDDLADRLQRYGLTFSYSPSVLAAHQFHGGPSTVTTKSTAKSNDYYDGGKTLFRQRQKEGIVRNIAHEWGQYPRDMKSLPWISGTKELCVE